MQLTLSLHKAARERPTAMACMYGPRRTDHRTFLEQVARLAGALRASGVEPGDRVGLLALNSDRYLLCLYAILWAGGVINPINIRWSLSEMAYSLDDSETGVLFVDDSFTALAPLLRERCTHLRYVLSCAESDSPVGCPTFSQLLAYSPIDDVRRAGDDLAALLYTGGTTGTPKGVMLSHSNLLGNALSTLAAAPRESIDKVLQVAPLFHVGGLALVLQAALRGACHVIHGQFDPTAILRSLVDERIGETFLVPTMLQRLLDAPEFTSQDLSALRTIVYGAAPMAPALLERAKAALPRVAFIQVYGMTELAPVVAALPTGPFGVERGGGLCPGSVGRPTPTCEVRIVDSTGVELPVGQCGEIVVRGPGVMQGYWKLPRETAEVLRDGWLHSGDGGFMDTNGVLHLADRIKDMIVSGGENIWSVEVEGALYQHPAVAQCAVIGVPHAEWGEAVHAVVVLHAGEAPDAAELIRHCRDRLAGYKCPRSIELREELPISAAGKILKYQLREAYLSRSTELSG
ncbi:MULTISPECIES: long-chain-fatty-acid--CoA ligase [Pseudomonas]|uniref:long-chain-fatty-acid--CoA ligase n=1 Tax=Pseudomonas nitroreducens TaxID=46680 RepID=UPI001E6080BD|nr:MULTISPECIES: long-chain-fatty-acid--CoA ligase [Pseudomonas]MCE4071487.1 long-chain-fatty-acid--CoA ligase [Pseudomonas nitritireducens]MCE4081263.1 long-chain-fatty-acid--CoA ligase [Pseudomonas nitroreducens]